MGVEKNEVFVKVAISKAAHLWECPLGELPVYKWPWKAKRALTKNRFNGKNALITVNEWSTKRFNGLTNRSNRWINYLNGLAIRLNRWINKILFKQIGNPFEWMNKTIYTSTCTPRFPGFHHNFSSMGHSF